MAAARDNEIKTLLTTIDSLNKTIESLNKANAELHETIRQLKEELVSMSNKFEVFFGKKSEKQKKDKQADKPTNEPPDAKPKAKKEINGGGGRQKWPESLPRVETIIDPPEEERLCKECGKPFLLISAQWTEILRFEPMKLYVERLIRNKYVADCSCSETRSVAGEPPIRPIDKGMVGSDIIAMMAVMKYADHLPLSRQATQVFKRAGIDFSESSMCRWMRIVADHLEPLYDLIHTLILKSFFVKIDASWAKYRALMSQGRCKQGYIWGFLGDADYPYIWYGFEQTGTRDGPARILGDYAGYVQCDAQNIYDRIFMPDGADMTDPDVVKRLPIEVGC